MVGEMTGNGVGDGGGNDWKWNGKWGMVGDDGEWGRN